jgi:thiosulfate/3-mercaptopyruvate sulfurtransferase
MNLCVYVRVYGAIILSMATDQHAIPSLVSTEWLAQRLGGPSTRVVDASWYLPTDPRNAAQEFAAAHIPGAVFFDLDASSDRSTSLPHMLPTAADFSARMSALGLSDSDDIVVYDGSGTNLSAARVWWMFRVFGHRAVAVLDGGLGAWSAAGLPLESGTADRPRGRFRARLETAHVRDLSAMRHNVDTQEEQVIDARSAGRFAGTAPEPRPGLRGGHIPGSRNLPYTELVLPNGKMRPPDELRQMFDAVGADLRQPIVVSCGSGTTACSLALALDLLGATNVSVYDGSWTEWAGRSDTPVETGRPGGRSR